MLQKVLLMGKSGAGKTSMRSIIFANYLARDTMRLGATIDVEHSHVRFLGNLVLNLWDCGGQEAFMENYFESQRDHIFRNVQVLIYVFDIESREVAKDMDYYASCLSAVKANSKNAKVFCLVHKMDLVPEEQREPVFMQRERELKKLAQPLGQGLARRGGGRAGHRVVCALCAGDAWRGGACLRVGGQPAIALSLRQQHQTAPALSASPRAWARCDPLLARRARQNVGTRRYGRRRRATAPELASTQRFSQCWAAHSNHAVPGPARDITR